MKALITGGAGFIGSHLAEALLARGDKVAVLDNLSTGSMQNIAGLKKLPGFEYIVDDVLNQRVLAEMVDDADVVYHLAAAVGVKLVVESPVRTIETNLKGTEVVLEAAAKKRKKVLLTSTSEVYGKGAKIPFGEDDDLLIGPSNKGRWSYACSKLMDEFLAIAYWKERKLPVVVVRLFNTVGPRQTGRYGMVIPNFVRQALTNKPITIYGTGKQQRAFGYVGDVVGALIALMDAENTNGEVFNVGNEVEISIEELAKLVKQMTGSVSELVYVPYDEAYEAGFEDMQRRVPDLGKVRKRIGYQPRTQLAEILQRVIEYERAQLQG
ncbi:MAG: nucleoside-diphosphate sugar epimerase [Verrucomicrobia bacterium GWF2_62_7]|nr:MAG: nucleoside-diphosphate sugar epimerase [Verrucomicrobia bacterium GWF2_62_7]